MSIRDLLATLKRRPMERKLYSFIDKSNVLESNFESAAIQPNEDYFSIRLCEMHLTYMREYFREFVPMAIAVSDFFYAKEKVSVPFFVGNKMLNNIESYVKGEYVDFRNTKIAGPIPYLGEDVALFIGLFRLEVSDLAKNLFSLLENIIKPFDLSGFSQYLSIAKSFGGGLPQLLGMKECEFRLGFRDVYTDIDENVNRFRQNYMVYVNCAENELASDSLWVKDGRLFMGAGKDTIRPVNKYDYCLVKIERLDTRNDYRSLEFYSLWEQAHSMLMDKAIEKAKFKKVEFQQNINASPDLTDAHKEELIKLFEIKFLTLQDRYLSEEVTRGQRNGSTTRGDDTREENNVRNFLQFSATVADKQKMPSRVGDGLEILSKTWTKIPFLQSPESELGQTDDDVNSTINSQLAVLKEVRKEGEPNPAALVDALTLATFQQ